jgi:hypothetical protein
MSVLEIGGGLHCGHGHELSEPGVSQVVLDEVADLPADEGIDTFDAM